MRSAEASLKDTNAKKAANVFNRIWDVFKGLIIAIAAVVLIADTVIVCFLLIIETEEHSKVELEMPYYSQTQDYLDLIAMYEKAPDSAEYRAMRKAFNAKYSVPYNGMQEYIDLARAHRENPNSEEYNELLEKFLEVYDIAVEDISFEDSEIQ